MRLIDVFLLTSAVCLVGGAAHWLVARMGGAEPPSGAPGLRDVTVVSAIQPAYRRVHLQESAAPGHVAFVLGDGELLSGAGTALLFPLETDRIAIEKWVSVVATQTETGFDLRHWLAKAKPSGTHVLRFGLWVQRDEGLELRQGWAQIEPSDLVHAALAIEAPRDRVVEIRVETENGEPVPGAFMTLDPPAEPASLTACHLFTGEDGVCRLSGLPTSSTWTVRLPEGVGPDRTRVEQHLRGSDGTVTLRAPLRGAWQYVRHDLDAPMRGAAITVAELVDHGAPLPRVFPVSPWLGPGRASTTPMYVMTPARDEATAVRTTVRFRGFEPVLLDDGLSSTVLELQRGGAVVVRE